MIRVVLQQNGASVNGSMFNLAPRLESLLTAMGKPAVREKQILDQGRLWRNFVVLDEVGVCLLYDVDGQCVIDITFRLGAAVSSNSPRSIFAGLLFVNNTRLIPAMKEKDLPTRGEFEFVKRGAWKATKGALFVEMQLRDRLLSAVSLSFLKSQAL